MILERLRGVAMRLARFPLSLTSACTLAFLAFCLAPGYGVKADGGGAARPHSVRLSRLSPQNQTAPVKYKPRTQAHILEAVGNQSLIFEPNQGQTDDQVKFLSRGKGFMLFLTPTEAVLALAKTSGPGSQSGTLRLKLEGANPEAEVVALDVLPSKSNYFIGNDSRKWRANVPNYARVRFKNVYPGVDLIYYGNQRQVEYDFVVAPGADPSPIMLAIGGASDGRRSGSRGPVQIDCSGNLVVHTTGGKVHLRKPVVYQLSQGDGDRTYLDGRYVLRSSATQGGEAGFANREHKIRFQLAAYDRTKAVVIDPVLTYSTYLGGSQEDAGNSIAVDSSGNAYVAGLALSADFPTSSPIQATTGGGYDAFVAKLDAAGSSPVYTTYLGGAGSDQALGIATDSSGNAYVTGQTSSNDFPLANPLQATMGGGYDAFVTKLDATGAPPLVYSTYLGGSGTDKAFAIAVDGVGSAYVTGQASSNNFPLANALQPVFGGIEDAFVAKVNKTGTGLVYSTYLGGSSTEETHGIAVDSSGNAYVTGWTSSSNFPTANAAQKAYAGAQDAFLAKLDSAGATLVYSTYLGGNGVDQGLSIAVDSSGQAYVTGLTASTNFPVANALQPTYGGNQDAFVTKLSATGVALIFSTYLGGHDADGGASIALDSAASPYVTGATFSNDFPTASPIQATTGGGYDAFVAKLAELTFPAVTLSPTTLPFAEQPVGTSSTPQTLTLNNNGDALLTITSLVISGNYAQTNTCGSSVAAGTNCTIDVTFTPTAAGTRTGTVTITDDAVGSPRVVLLTGTGVAPNVALSRTSVTFGNQGVGTTSASQTVTLANTGNAPLAISSVAISGDFAETNTCGASVAASASCDISVTFTPTTTGTRTGTLTITDDATGSPHLVQLAGGGVATFSLSSPDSSATVSRGTDSTTFSISAASQYGFTGSISLACLGNAPANCAFSPASIAPGESSTLTISNLTAVSASGLNLTVVGTSHSQTASLSLTVQFPDFTSLVTPPSATISAGQSASYTLSLTPLSGFNQAVSLSCNGAPTAATCTVSPSSVTVAGSNTSTATVTVTTTAASMVGPGQGPSVMLPPLGNPAGMRWLVWLLAIITMASWLKAQRRVRLGFAVMMLFVLAWTACSVGGSEKPPFTLPGNYQLTITAAASGGLQHITAVSLTVK
jgi:hypothetical protein